MSLSELMLQYSTYVKGVIKRRGQWRYLLVLYIFNLLSQWLLLVSATLAHLPFLLSVHLVLLVLVDLAIPSKYTTKYSHNNCIIIITHYLWIDSIMNICRTSCYPNMVRVYGPKSFYHIIIVHKYQFLQKYYDFSLYVILSNTFKFKRKICMFSKSSVYKSSVICCSIFVMKLTLFISCLKMAKFIISFTKWSTHLKKIMRHSLC